MKDTGATKRTIAVTVARTVKADAANKAQRRGSGR